MFRLIAVTLAALYGVLLVFGDQTRRPEVTRADTASLPLFDASLLESAATVTDTPTSEISDSQAVELAMAAARADRDSRKARAPVELATLETVTPSADTVTDEPAPSYWYVTGSNVNLRGGPGTSNPVVGQATLGAEAEVLADEGGWYEIRLADGSASGWIFGRFLGEQRPG